MSEEAPKCPHCQGVLHIEMIAKAAPRSRMVFAQTPSPGEKITAKAFGLSLAAFADFLKAVGRDMEVPTEVLLDRLETSPDGKQEAHVLIVRFEEATARRKRIRAAKATTP